MRIHIFGSFLDAGYKFGDSDVTLSHKVTSVVNLNALLHDTCPLRKLTKEMDGTLLDGSFVGQGP